MVKSKPKQKRKMTPTRFKVLRSDSSIETAQKTVETTFGLPTGAVKLVYPSGRKARADSTVGALLKYWGSKG